MPGITLTPEKLDMLAANVDPKPFFSLLAQSGGLMTPSGGAGANASFANFVQPQGTEPGTIPRPLMTPQMMQGFLPKAPQVLPPAGLPAQRQIQAPAQFQAPMQPQPSFSQLLMGR